MAVGLAERDRVVEQGALHVGQQVVEHPLDRVEAVGRLLTGVAAGHGRALRLEVSRPELDPQRHAPQLLVGEFESRP